MNRFIPLLTALATGMSLSAALPFAQPDFAMPLSAPVFSNPRCGLWVNRSADCAGWNWNPDGSTLIGEGPVVSTYPFTNLVASWNCAVAAGEHVQISVRVRFQNHWSREYVMGCWAGAGQGSSVPGQEDQNGRVTIDTLVLRHPADACQMRVRILGNSESAVRPAPLSLAALCWQNSETPLPPPAPLVEGWRRVLPVPFFSQLIQEKRIAGEICSPTSLAMALSYFQLPCTPMQAAAGVRDRAEDIYGNWPLNTAFAADRGCPSFVARFWSLEQIQNEIASGRPVEASIRWKEGDLDGAPIRRSNGHLVLVVGFTDSGDPEVNDPAARSEAEVRRVYRRDQFLRCWLEGSGGIVYLFEPSIRAGDLQTASAPSTVESR